MTFPNEQALVASFLEQLATDRSPWAADNVATEFFYQRGRTDVVFTEHEAVVAVEAKLKDWRGAMHQAFRNRCFAHRSYVLLPKKTALRAFEYAGEFDRRQVGICYMEGDTIVVLQAATSCEPVEPWLSLRAKRHIESSGSVA